MAIGDIKTFDIVYQGLTLEVNAIDIGGGKTRFDVKALEGSADINALYWNDGDTTGGEGTFTGLGAKGDSSLNMNGSGEVWDGGIKLSSAGIGAQGLDKPTYLQTGENYTSSDVSVDISQITKLGVRATSTSTADGSIKGVDEGDLIAAPKVCVEDVEVTEGDTASFEIHLDSAYAYDVTVNYKTVTGTAGTSDYTEKTGSITITAGTKSVTVDVQTTEDTAVEVDEIFTLHIDSVTIVIPGLDITSETFIKCNDGEGTIKDDDTDGGNDPNQPPATELTFGGLSQGFWTGANGAHIDQWDGQHGLTTGTSAEDLFGVNFTGDASDLTLLGALDAKGGGAINLARQATAAIINVNNPEDLGGYAYRFTSAEIISAVQQVFEGGVYNSTKGGQLADVLEFWDHASDDEKTPDTNLTADDVLTLLVAGANSPNVNTDANSFAGVTGTGSMFTGTLAQVMHELYPANWA